MNFKYFDERSDYRKKYIYRAGLILTMLLTIFFSLHTVSASMIYKNGQAVKILFVDSQGNTLGSLTQSASIGSTVTLPYVPGHENASSSGWKPDSSASASGTVFLTAGSTLLLALSSDIMDYINDNGQLILYAVNGYDPCTITFYNNSGQNRLYTYTAAYGSTFILPDYTRSGYTVLGWTRTKGSTDPLYSVGQTITVKENLVFYLIRYKTSILRTLTYRSSGGGTNAKFQALSTSVKYGTKVKLASLPASSAYYSLGWSRIKGASTASYKAGQVVTLKGNVTLYAVYKKRPVCKVTFANNAGKSTSAVYKALAKNIYKGRKVTLPQLPAVTGYQALGWATSAKQTAAKYQAGSQVTISADTTFYAVYTGACTVTLHKKDGTVWKTVTVNKGASYTLPGAVSASGYTMMGWSYSPNQSQAAEFEVGEEITVNSNCHLYAVAFNRQSEADLTSAQMPSLDSTSYDQVIFVGDSRTVYMMKTLQRMDDNSFLTDIYYVAEEGQGLSWLKSTAYEQILDLLSADRKTALIFNLGVNDLANSGAYVTYLNRIAATLKQEGAVLFFMSINPVSYANRAALGLPARKESVVRSFNAALKAGLTGSFTYIDIYSYLMQTGYGHDAGTEGLDTGKDDGLHFTTKTYKRIFAKCMEFLLYN